MPIGLSHLKSIGAAARLGSLSRTAQALNITQPALSRRIMDAELALGVKLFERMTYGVKPTAECLALLPYAEAALANVENVYEAALNRLEARNLEVTISFLESMCDDALIDACKDTMAAIKGSSINFNAQTLPSQVSEEVLSGRATLGLKYFRDDRPELDSAWVMDDTFVVVCPPTHRFAKTGTASIEEMAQEQWIGQTVLVEPSTIHFEEAIEMAGMRNWKTWKMDNVEVRMRLLKAGLGIGLMRRAAIRTELENGDLVEIDAPFRGSLPLYLTWKRGAFMGQTATYMSKRLHERYAMDGPF